MGTVKERPLLDPLSAPFADPKSRRVPIHHRYGQAPRKRTIQSQPRLRAKSSKRASDGRRVVGG
jgi:hypothetical protein